MKFVYFLMGTFFVVSSPSYGGFYVGGSFGVSYLFLDQGAKTFAPPYSAVNFGQKKDHFRPLWGLLSGYEATSGPFGWGGEVYGLLFNCGQSSRRVVNQGARLTLMGEARVKISAVLGANFIFKYALGKRFVPFFKFGAELSQLKTKTFLAENKPFPQSTLKETTWNPGFMVGLGADYRFGRVNVRLDYTLSQTKGTASKKVTGVDNGGQIRDAYTHQLKDFRTHRVLMSLILPLGTQKRTKLESS